MKKTFLFVAVGALFLGSLAGPAVAKKKVKPAPVTFYLHGTQPAGEAQMDETWLNSNWMTMDSTEPAAGQPKSIFVTNYMRGPNTDCNGNGLLPVWRGNMAGKVKGDVTLTLHTIGTPTVQLVASLYADGSGQCAADGSNPALPAAEAPQPAAQETVDVPPGPGVTEIVFKDVNFKAAGNLLVQLHIPNMTSPAQVRVLYDSADYASGVSFSCTPLTGKSCIQ